MITVETLRRTTLKGRRRTNGRPASSHGFFGATVVGMTAKEAVDIAFAASRRERQSRFARICRLRGFCQTEALENDAGRWMCCR